MCVQIVDADAKPKGRGDTIFSAAAKCPGGIVNVAYTQPAICVWKGSGNSCPADKYMNIRAQRVATGGIKHGTNQVANRFHAIPSVEDIRSTRVTEVQFCA
jgi:hypothetical protein